MKRKSAWNKVKQETNPTIPHTAAVSQGFFVTVVSFVLLGLIYNGKIMKREIRPSKQREHNSNKEGKEVKKNKAQTTKKRALLNFTYLLCLCSLCFSLFFTTHLSLHSFHSFSRVFLFNWNENKRSERRERSACFFQLNNTERTNGMSVSGVKRNERPNALFRLILASLHFVLSIEIKRNRSTRPFTFPSHSSCFLCVISLTNEWNEVREAK